MENDIKPNTIILDVLSNIKDYKNKNILDIGCGEGTDSIFLAKKGFKVTSLDSSGYIIHKLSLLIKKDNLNIKLIKDNILEFNPKEKYDFILLNNILHFLKKEEVKNIINKTKEMTKKNGLNIISYFEEKTNGKENILEYYKDWKIIHNKINKEIINHKEHTIVKIIAKKSPA